MSGEEEGLIQEEVDQELAKAREEIREIQHHAREMQLVAREGVLTQILEEYEFPTPNHRRVIELLYEETVDEMRELGLEEVEEKDLK